MAERSLPWARDEGGDESPHSFASLASWFKATNGVSGANDAVLPQYLSELAPSSIATNTQIRIAPGAAIVDGKFYETDANLDYTPVTPTTGTTGRRAVLRADWTAQTVRVVEISSADGTAAIPALTQTTGITYEVPLCSYTVTTGGTIGAFADTRGYAGTRGWALVASNTAETTTTSTSAVDMITLSGLDIATDQMVKITGVARKDALAASRVEVGLKVNSTVVAEAGATGIWRSTTTQQAEDGYFETIIYPRSPNYLTGLQALYQSRVSSTAAAGTAATFAPGISAPMPNATITSLTIRGINTTNNNNLAVKDVYIYVSRRP